MTRQKPNTHEKFGLEVSPPIGFANDFAILIRGDVARKNDLKTISDAVPLMQKLAGRFRPGFYVSGRWISRFLKAYGFNFAKQPREMDLSLIDRALQSGELDIIAGTRPTA